MMMKNLVPVNLNNFNQIVQTSKKKFGKNPLIAVVNTSHQSPFTSLTVKIQKISVCCTQTIPSLLTFFSGKI